MEPEVSVPMRGHAHSGSDRSACARRRSAADSFGVPGISGGTEGADHAAHAEGEFVHIELADNHRSRLLQLPHDLGIFGGMRSRY